MNSAFMAPFFPGLGAGGGGGIPASSLLAKGLDITDQLGANARPLQQLQYIQSAGGLDLTNASITGTETVTSKQGTATVTVSAGKLTVGSGTLWSLALSNGSQYEYGTALSSTTGICFDVSGNGRHLTFTVADTSSVCITSRDKGSDWLNLKGFSKRSNVVLYSEDASNAYWVKAGSPTITNNSGYQTVKKTATGSTTVEKVANLANTANKKMYVSFTVRPQAAGKVMAINIYDAITLGYLSGVQDNLPSDRFTTLTKIIDNSSNSNNISPWLSEGTSSLDNLDIKNARVFFDPVFDIYSDGDSISKNAVESWGSSTFNSFTRLLEVNLGVGVVHNAVGGQTLAQISPRVVSNMSGASYKTVILDGGSNDIFNSSSDPSAGMLTNQSVAINAAKASSSLVIVFNCPESSSFSSNQKIWANSYNALLLAMYNGDPKVIIIDLHSIMANNPSLIHSDGTHLNMSGHEYIYNLIKSKIVYSNTYPGYIKTTSFPIVGKQPAVNGTIDSTGLTAQYPGQAKNSISKTVGTGTDINDTDTYQLADSQQMRSATGWIYGTANVFYNADGTCKSLTGAQLESAAVGPLVRVGDKKWLVFKDSDNAKKGLSLS